MGKDIRDKYSYIFFIFSMYSSASFSPSSASLSSHAPKIVTNVSTKIMVLSQNMAELNVIIITSCGVINILMLNKYIYF